MRAIVVTVATVVLAGVVTAGVGTYAPQLVPTTAFGIVGLVVVAVTAVFTFLASASQIIDTIDRLLDRRSADRRRHDVTGPYKTYRDLVLRTCEVIDLTELPLLDATLTMQEFTIQQLYIPLRLLVDLPVETPAATVEADTLESRSFTKGIEVGRITEQRHTASPPQEISIGALLNRHAHVVILGDPGSGKSTLVKWLALALILRDSDVWKTEQFPDAAALPDTPSVPILVRCRDIEKPETMQVLDDLLGHCLRIRALSGADQSGLKEFLTDQVGRGRALLIVDGLDEIPDQRLRTSFARRLQEIAQQHSGLPMVVTSRIVGYNEMRSRLGVHFNRATIADLKTADKDTFAERWCRATVPEIDRPQQIQRLISAIDSTDDIKRVTNNALLLTILAIVHRKLHKLPHRRAELYRCFMQVLLDFNPTIYDRIDAREAHPQLCYLAHAMERAHATQFDEDRILDLLTELRESYQIRAVDQRPPEEFLARIQRQTSIVVQTGYVTKGGREVAVYEFKHETFKHYFAGLALVENMYTGCARGSRLGERIRFIFDRPDVGTRHVRNWKSITEWAVEQNWREAIRLCVASASLNDAEDALDSMIGLPTEAVAADDKPLVVRMGAVMAALCLADEPNVGINAGRRVIDKLLGAVVDADGFDDKENTTLDEAVAALSRSQDWAHITDERLLTSLETYPNYEAWTYGSLYIMCHPEHFAPVLALTPSVRTDLLCALRSDELSSVTRACLTLVNILYRDSTHDGIDVDPELTDALFAATTRGHAELIVALWALAWFWDRYYVKDLDRALSQAHLQRLSDLVLHDTHPYVLRCACQILGFHQAGGGDFILRWATAADSGVLSVPSLVPTQPPLSAELVARMLELLTHPRKDVQRSFAVSGARLGIHSEASVNLLFEMMTATTLPERARDSAVEALVRIGGQAIADRLLSQLDVDDDYVQTRSMLALIGLNSPDVVNGLCERLTSPSAETRFFATAGLAVFIKNGLPAAVDALTRALVGETKAKPRSEMARVLDLQQRPSEDDAALEASAIRSADHPE